jgi:hypothetical protein
VPERQTVFDTLGHYEKFFLCAGHGVSSVEFGGIRLRRLKVPLPQFDRFQYGLRHDQAPLTEKVKLPDQSCPERNKAYLFFMKKKQKSHKDHQYGFFINKVK